MVSSGPVGPCSPGIHLGNTSVKGPGRTLSVRSVCTCLRVISRASTRTVSSVACAAAAAAIAAYSSTARDRRYLIDNLGGW